jgi:hypothetical protein
VMLRLCQNLSIHNCTAIFSTREGSDYLALVLQPCKVFGKSSHDPDPIRHCTAIPSAEDKSIPPGLSAL